MMNTIAPLLTFLATIIPASPPQSVSDTVVRRQAAAPASVVRRTEAVDIVSDAHTSGRARSLRDLARVRLVLDDGASFTDGPSSPRALSLRELVASRLVLADGDSIGANVP